MTKQLTDAAIQRLSPRAKRFVIADVGVRGLFVRVLPSGVKAFVVVARDPYAKQVWQTIERTDLMEVETARDRARNILKRIRAGQPPIEELPAKPESVQAVCEAWYQRVVLKQEHRRADDVRRCLDKYILPPWKHRDFASLKRSDLAKLLDHVEDNHGSRTADLVAARVKAIARWYTSRNDDFNNPFFGSNTRRHHKPARSRILDDNELRMLWSACDDCGRYGDLLRLALLTGQRFTKIRTIRWDDLHDNEWLIRTQAREKSNAIALQLPDMAMEIINRQPRTSNPHIFWGRNGKAMSVSTIPYRLMAKGKLPKFAEEWVPHDLRRSARSLMARAQVQPNVAERTLGHSIEGVERVYDRHDYAIEKRDALRALATLIERIVRGEDGKVISISARRS